MALSTFRKDIASVNKVEYCGYVELRRPIFKKDNSFTSGEFHVLTHSGQTGVSYISSQGLRAKDINQTS